MRDATWAGAPAHTADYSQMQGGLQLASVIQSLWPALPYCGSSRGSGICKVLLGQCFPTLPSALRVWSLALWPAAVLRRPGQMHLFLNSLEIQADSGHLGRGHSPLWL